MKKPNKSCTRFIGSEPGIVGDDLTTEGHRVGQRNPIEGGSTIEERGKCVIDM